MTFLDRRHLGADQAGASLDTAMVTVRGRILLAFIPSRIFEQRADSGVQRATIALERQCVVSSVFDDLQGAKSHRQLSGSVVTIVPLKATGTSKDRVPRRPRAIFIGSDLGKLSSLRQRCVEMRVIHTSIAKA